MTADRSSWVPPFFTCGECGGEIGRWPMLNLLRQEILDWRHRSVPPGTAEHRAVLGTKAHTPRLLVEEDTEEVDEESLQVALTETPPPDVPARPALRDDLPSSALSIDRLAAEHGWAVEAWYWKGTRITAHWRPNKVVETVQLRMVRDGHGLTAAWELEPDAAKPGWKFADAFTIGHVMRPIGSPELRRMLAEPRTRCETCGEVPALHVWTESGLLCHADWNDLHRGGTS